VKSDEVQAAERELGGRLAHYRAAKGLTPAELANDVGVSPQVVARLESGESTTCYATVLRVCDALDIDLPDLLRAELPRARRTHDVDLPSDQWHLVDAGIQTFDLRRDTGPFIAGDRLRMHEYLNGADTGRVLDAKICHLAHGEQFGIAPGWVVLRIRRFTP
jgi:transcriptional regulator with XRE-family HTH domain